MSGLNCSVAERERLIPCGRTRKGGSIFLTFPLGSIASVLRHLALLRQRETLSYRLVRHLTSRFNSLAVLRDLTVFLEAAVQHHDWRQHTATNHAATLCAGL